MPARGRPPDARAFRHAPDFGQPEVIALPDDPLSALDARLAALRTVRANAARFSDAFWEADDTLAWLRALRDELVRTGRVRDELQAYLEGSPAVVSSETDDPGEEPRTALPTLVPSGTAVRPDVKADAPIVAA